MSWSDEDANENDLETCLVCRSSAVMLWMLLPLVNWSQRPAIPTPENCHFHHHRKRNSIPVAVIWNWESHSGHIEVWWKVQCMSWIF